MNLLEFNLLRTDQDAESLEDLCLLNGNLVDPNEFESVLEELQARLSELEEPPLVKLAIRARHIEWCAFILRGMCASELRRRYTLRLTGGRSKRDQAGKGIQAHIRRLAASIGVSSTTLMTDARISDTFFSSFSSIEDTTRAREHTLPREFYVIALSAPDPHGAIRMAAQHMHNGEYTREQFRAYVRTLKGTARPHQRTPKSHTFGLLRVHISGEVQAALDEIVQLTGKSEAEEVAAMILARHKTLRQRDKKIMREEFHNAKSVKSENPSQMTLILQCSRFKRTVVDLARK